MITTAAPRTSIMTTYKRWPVRFESGRGSTLVDSEDRHYIDLVAGIAVATVGHAHPAVVEAIAQQASRLIHVSNLYETGPQLELAERLAGLSGGMRTFFCNSGAEAIECAIKLTRRWAGPTRPRIVAASGGFHGRTFGALSATGQSSKSAAYAPLVPGFGHVAFDDLDALGAALGDDVAAVLVEPIQGEAGVIVPDEAYLAGVRDLCNRHGTLLILDEVQTGVGRTGTWFAFERAGIVPDIVCLAKALGGGLPIGACLARPPVAEVFTFGDHGSTFGGGPVQCAAALAVLDVIESEVLLERAGIIGRRMREGLGRIFGPPAVRGRGGLLAAALPLPVATRVASGALARGLLINDPTPDVLRFTPPLVISDEEMNDALGILEEVWCEVAAS